MRRVKEEDKPCEARTDGLPCDFQEDGHKSVFVCRYCGRVGQRILSTSQGKVFEHDDEKNLRADKGKTTDPLTTVVSSSVYTSNTSNLAAGLTARDRTISFTKRKSEKEKNMEKYRHVLSEQCLKMQLNGATMDYCLELFDGYMKDMHTFPMHHIKAIILGALFYACKHGGAPRTPAELADQTHTKLREVRQGMKLVSKRCSMIMTSDVQKTSQNLVDRYCDELGLDMPFISKAREVDDKIRQYVEGKHSNTVAATDIALTFEWFYPPEQRRDQARIAELAGLKLATLRKSIAQVQEEMRKANKSPADIISVGASVVVPRV